MHYPDHCVKGAQAAKTKNRVTWSGIILTMGGDFPMGRDSAGGASVSLNRTISEITTFLSDQGRRPGGRSGHGKPISNKLREDCGFVTVKN